MKLFSLFTICIPIVGICFLNIACENQQSHRPQEPKVTPQEPKVTPQEPKVTPQEPTSDIPPLFIAYRKTNDFKRGEDAKRWLEQKGYTVKQAGNTNVYFLYRDNQLVTHGHQVTYYQNELWIAALKSEYDPDEIDRKHWENMIQGWKNEGYTQKSADWLKTRPNLHIRPENIGKGAVIMAGDVIVTKDNNGNLLVFVKSR